MKSIPVKGLERECSVIVLGTSFFRPQYKDLVFAIVDTYLEYGGNVLDTSRIYGAGESERAVGMWLTARQNRKDLMIISKGCHHYVNTKGVHYPEQ